jgi:hypothetical protein
MLALSWACHFFEIRDPFGEVPAMESNKGNEKLTRRAASRLISDLIMVS